MKEITTELTLRVTMIEKVADKKADQVILDAKDAAVLKELFGVDDLKIVSAKSFVRDIPSKKKKD